ncbi:hypothetical protein OA163_00755 [bacterium]|nr:hypothetical protein [bacterium]
MNFKRRFWFLAYPDLNKAVGGIKQIHRVAEIIDELGFFACIVQEKADFRPHWFESHVNTISRSDWFKKTDFDPQIDIVVLAETFVPLVPSLLPGIPKIVFNQNASYTFGLPSKTVYKPSAIQAIYHHQDVLQVWCVSRTDHNFMVRGLDLPVSKVYRVINAIDFEHSPIKPLQKKHQICYMSRKNSLHSSCVINILRRKKWLNDWKFLEIKNLSHAEVISIMMESTIFLSFGHPEGFGLPVAEALASQCAVVGYDGIGGRELFDLSSNYGLSKSVPFGDWTAFTDATFKIYSEYILYPDLFRYQLERMSSQVRLQYSFSAMHRSIQEALDVL